MRWLDSITDTRDMSLSKLKKRVKDGEAWHVAVHGIAKSYEMVKSITDSMGMNLSKLQETQVHGIRAINSSVRMAS